ncbi:hypothetical protein Y032_0314g2210 [Ancylostoma ceylanicum]|uniref:Uncharacterized protein n=1 Tax=Ancylostoma ceylanicum TaxID=53326 RepID=A0A016S2I2_9BILA|nr:hypothetical protein Y032_0314g2210 [Ancylostoma ceylanicum]
MERCAQTQIRGGKHRRGKRRDASKTTQMVYLSLPCFSIWCLSTVVRSKKRNPVDPPPEVSPILDRQRNLIKNGGSVFSVYWRFPTFADSCTLITLHPALWAPAYPYHTNGPVEDR